MAQFSLKRLFAGVTFVAIGLGALAWEDKAEAVYGYLIWIALWPIMGAGVFLPFNRPLLGMIVGVAVMFLINLIRFS